MEYNEEYKKLVTLVLNVTENCNLKCKYCFVNKQPNYMPLDVAIQAVEYGQKNKKNDFFTLVFFGGEPLLCYESIIKPLVNYIKEKQYNINFSITTNGTLLTKEKIDFFKENNFYMLFSFDGSKSTQDYNRSNSFDLIYKNIPYLLQQYPNITCRSTTYVDTVSNLYQDYLFLNDCGFKHWDCGFDTSSRNWEEKDLIILEEQLIKIINNKKELNMINLSTIKTKTTTDIPLKYAVTNIYNRCGLGTLSQTVNYEGKIFSCHHNSDKNNILCIGDIYNGIDDEKHKKLLDIFTESLINPVNCEFCEKCNMQKICRFEYDGLVYCLIENYLKRNNFNKMNQNVCKIQNLFYKYAQNT